MPDRKKVLIIDDEIDLCLLLKSYFLRKAYDVYLSHTLEEGITFLKTLNPDIVFLDNNLPDGEGWKSAPQLSMNHPDIQLVLISAFHPSLPAMPEGANVLVIEKPIGLKILDEHFSQMHLQSAK